ncbi:hypothetical protein PILCRDRAFT_816057 [Piloderma croceum F 1598]|uniref:Uncharacterized protein n=1 Tax=Piloderma croceum (strain F 1598) TaxID=765440 RepID=A0A0C3CAS7_PILCF|nr:hypothetical protein PILCRDRAFT_816057 [Piloderma croceum F 1598]
MAEIAARSPLSVVFLLHLALETPVAVQGLWSPTSLPFLEMNNTTVIILKLYASLVLATCLTSFLCFSLPEFLPGKRALAIGLCVYHSTVSTVLFNAPRFIPYSLGPLAESFKITPEIIWGVLHGVLSLGMIAWWQGTLHYTQIAKKMQ